MLLALAQGVDFSKKIEPLPLPEGWVDLPAHPSISGSPTPEGRRIRAMVPHGDHLLLGYGDWAANTGPVDVAAYRIDTGEPVTLLSDCPTEAFDRVRILDGRAYLPSTDPTVGNVGGFATDRSGSWAWEALPSEITVLHAFDMEIIGGRLHMCGSTAPPDDTGISALWREDSPGVWSQVLTLDAPGSPFNAPRFYKFIPDGAGWVVRSSGSASGMRTEDGETWTAFDASALPDPFSSDPRDTLPVPFPEGSVYAKTAGGWHWAAYPDGSVKRKPA